MSLKLQIIICSTRPGRVGPKIARWFHDVASELGYFETELVDLADFNLPVYDEPNHPRMQQYQHDHTKTWAATVAKADAYVFVTPEYNFGPPPALVNALNYLYNEWNYKPCGFVSYGGVSGGLRSAQSAKQLVTTLKMMPMVEGVMVQMPWELLDDAQHFAGAEVHKQSAKAMLEEMAKWADALKVMR
ncbi:NAD(P)H-dependent oxidoreductase [Pseudidiomarina sp.]|uniref:NADPH-dependent FMN reductase n=1 Tax=Pseudidiomarina sp. TaxID=2081707 RepID=UPI00299F1279|nr:NAD(P)H-dependent oxidoreductase [Pseudidiomarina sp.]MDX1705736.1 NAD(P)H-dependent oxidoreductase [Pseudidiomarina sp.]